MKQLVTCLFFVTTIWACQKDSNTTVSPTLDDASSSIHLTLGNPSNALADNSNLTNYLLVKPQYVSSYNSRSGKANWTAWYLSKSDIGTAVRKNDFRPDDALPDQFYHVKSSDYTSTDGFDRGHMCPSADRTLDQATNSATFLMTNIAPQAPELNRGLWEDFEAYCREQANIGNEVYIYAGSYNSGGQGSNGWKTTLANSNVLVPARYFKIALILPFGSDDLNRITENTTVLAIDVPNTQAVSDDWSDYCTTVAAIEKATNLTFWTKISSLVAGKLKQKACSVAKVTPPTSTTSSPTTPVTTTPTSPTTTIPTPTTTTPSTPSTPSSCGYHNGKKLYKGPEGGCYYINSKGNKTYVDRSECSC